MIGSLLLAQGVSSLPAAAEVSKEAAVATILQSYDVRVLRIRAAELDNIPVWLVTVMQPGGDFNTAFQVNTLAVEKATGELVPSFRHGSSGLAASPGGATRTRTDARPESMRTGTWR